MNDDFRAQTFEIIRQLTGNQNSIVIPRLFVTLLEGDYTAAAILNQILYWTDRTRNKDGWFYKSYTEWEEETGLTRYQVIRAVKGDKRSKNKGTTLQEVGVETELRKSPKGAPTIHYRINRSIFLDALAKAAAPILNNVEEPTINIVQYPSSTKSTIDVEQSRKSYTETTAENTEKIAAPKNGADSPLPKKHSLSKGNGKATVPAVQMNPMKDALAAAFKQSWDGMTGIEAGKYQRAAKELCVAGRNPEDVQKIYDWCIRQGYQSFTPVALAAHAMDALGSKDAPAEVNRGSLDYVLGVVR